MVFKLSEIKNKTQALIQDLYRTREQQLSLTKSVGHWYQWQIQEQEKLLAAQLGRVESEFQPEIVRLGKAINAVIPTFRPRASNFKG